MKTRLNRHACSKPIVLPRIHPVSPCTNPLHGHFVWAARKSLWFTAHALIALFAGMWTFSVGAFVLFAGFTALTLCLGLTVGLHRLLVHRSFECPRWLEYLLMHFGLLVGMGGPRDILLIHDMRDWAQRHAECHPFYSEQGPLWRTLWHQMHFNLRLDRPPAFLVEARVTNDPVYRWMQRTWMWHQLPWAALFYLAGGLGWVVWGISMRIVVSLTGHWLVGYFVHNLGDRDWHLQGHGVQGFNLRHLGLLTMGEAWHNNHHAFPGSARMGFDARQLDPGWWFIRLLMACGLAWDVKTPAHFPPRSELVPVPFRRAPKPRARTFFAR